MGSHVRTSEFMAFLTQNQLVVFLVANVLTGLVNLGVNTLEMEAWPAFVLLCVYVVATVGLSKGIVEGVKKVKVYL